MCQPGCWLLVKRNETSESSLIDGHEIMADHQLLHVYNYVTLVSVYSPLINQSKNSSEELRRNYVDIPDGMKSRASLYSYNIM